MFMHCFLCCKSVGRDAAADDDDCFDIDERTLYSHYFSIASPLKFTSSWMAVVLQNVQPDRIGLPSHFYRFSIVAVVIICYT